MSPRPSAPNVLRTRPSGLRTTISRVSLVNLAPVLMVRPLPPIIHDPYTDMPVHKADCIAAIQGALCEMQQSGVWLGALWWAAGPWWGDVSSRIYHMAFQDQVLIIHSVLPVDRTAQWACHCRDPASSSGTFPLRTDGFAGGPGGCRRADVPDGL